MSASQGLVRIRDYFAAEDPRQSLGNAVAFIVLSNQPFYPLYVYFILGERAWPALLTWLSSPLFAAVPSVARRDRRTAARLLLLAGIGNTGLCASALGTASGVELFYLPCAALAVLLAPGGQRSASLLFAVLAVAAGVAAARFVNAGAGMTTIEHSEIASLVKLHAVSVIGLTVVIAYLSRSIWRA